MILVALEGVQLEAAELGVGAVEQAAVVHDLFQKQGVGAIENREIELAPREQGVQIVAELPVLPQTGRRPIQENAEIHVASFVELAADGRSELQEQPDAVALRDLVEIGLRHGVDYTSAAAESNYAARTR